MNISQSVVDYLRQHDLRLTTAESCTAGKIVTLLAEVPGSGDLIESGYVVYSPEAKQRLLKVSPANVAVATTGILGPEDVDGIPAGTICFAWAYQTERGKRVFTHEHRFFGSRSRVQLLAAEHALKRLSYFHQRAVAGEPDQVEQ